MDERRISCLDYLIYQIRGKATGKRQAALVDAFVEGAKENGHDITVNRQT